MVLNPIHELIFMAPTGGPQASQNTSNLDGQRPLGCMIYCTKESIHVDGRFLFAIHNFNIQSISLHTYTRKDEEWRFDLPSASESIQDSTGKLESILTEGTIDHPTTLSSN